MSDINITSPATAPVINLSEARHNLVGAVIKTGTVVQTYADGICAAFNLLDNQGNVTTPWYELKGKLKAGVKDERALFVIAMSNVGFGKGTIDVYWQRIKEASGYVTAGNRAKGATDTDSKTVTELKTIINRIYKAEESGEECVASNFKGQLMEIFEELGGDIDKLG
jgi:hypothetical protein